MEITKKACFDLFKEVKKNLNKENAKLVKITKDYIKFTSFRHPFKLTKDNIVSWVKRLKNQQDRWIDSRFGRRGTWSAFKKHALSAPMSFFISMGHLWRSDPNTMINDPQRTGEPLYDPPTWGRGDDDDAGESFEYYTRRNDYSDDMAGFRKSSKSIDKTSIVKLAAIDAGVTQKTAKAVADAIFKNIKNNLKSDGCSVNIAGFGQFNAKDRLYSLTDRKGKLHEDVTTIVTFRMSKTKKK